MKLKPRDKSEVYDKLYTLAGKILKKYSACASCPIGSCKTQYTRSWCCQGCKHLGPTGCTVQALACKLWLCDKEEINMPLQCRRRLYTLHRIAYYYDIYVVRGSKEESLRSGC